MNLSLSAPILCLMVATSATIINPQTFLASAQVAPECTSTVPYSYDSGETSSAFTTVTHASSPWIQLDLSDTYLAPNAELLIVGEKSSQVLDASALDANGYSAVFDGDSVSVELVTPGSIRSGSTSRVIVSAINIGLCKPGSDDGTSGSICAVVDDRIPSTDERVGRIGGCTGWLISEDVFIQAGHCGTPSTSTRIHFTYGVGSAAVEDQYAVDVETYMGVDGGVGNDWGAGRLLPNSSTGLLPGVAQEAKCVAAGKGPGCGWFTLGNVPSTTSGNNIRITGFGTAEVDSRSQKTHMDSLTTIASTYLRYVPDTTGGNSGSPVIHEETGHAIGVHTHGGCDSGGNQGTRIDRTEFADHVDFLTRPCTQDSDCFINGWEQCDANGQCQFGNAPTTSPTPNTLCDNVSNTERVAIKVKTDNYPAETSWTLIDDCTGTEVKNSANDLSSPYTSNGAEYMDEWCMPLHQYTFTINDSYGDGICCSWGAGSYEVYWGGAMEKQGGSFGGSETTTFGGSCEPVTPPTPPPTNPITPSPTSNPTNPVTPSPTKFPTEAPTSAPSKKPTPSPTESPVTPAPTGSPTSRPTDSPTEQVNCSQYTRANDCKFPCSWNGKDKVCTGP